MSEASSTDVALFRRLANPDVVDLEVEIRPKGAAAAAAAGSHAGAPKRGAREVVEKAMREAEAAAAPPGDGGCAAASAGEAPASQGGSTALRQAMQVEKAAAPPTSQKPETPRAPSSTAPGGDKKRPRQDEVDSSDEDAPRRRRAAAPEPAARPAPEPARKEEGGASAAARGSAGDEEGDRLEKQGLLIELQNLEARGVKLTRSFGMADSVAEMDFELNRHMANIATRNAVSFMRDSLRILISGMEIGNAKLGPFLSIDGWAESVTQDMNRYDHSLERIYKRYWRKQQMSPVMELAWLILGSMLTWHFKTKFFGPTAARPGPAPSAPAPSAPAASPATPASRGGAPAATPARRPTLRPPGASLLSSVFG